MQPHLVSVNLGRSQRHTARLVSSIDKRPVTGRVGLEPLGLVGDTVTNHKFHGGTHQAVYAYATEELAYWSGELEVELAPGSFGENLTTEGMDLNACLVGEVWRVGSAELQVSTVRIPCGTFAHWLELRGVPAAGWVRRFTGHGVPGVYLRVLEPGEIAAGDLVEVVARPDHAVTAETVFAALTTQRSRLPELLAAARDLPPKEVESAQKYAETHGKPDSR